MPPSDHLLRTLAAVPHTGTVLDLGCGEGRHTLPLLQLGFNVYACDPSENAVAAVRALASDHLAPADAEQRITHVPQVGALGYPDSFFDWVVAFDALSGLGSREEIVDALQEARRVLKPGGWLYVAVRALDPAFNPATPRTDYDYASDSAPAFSYTDDTLTGLMEEAGLALAEHPRLTPAPDYPRLEAIYRRTDPGTPV